MWQELSLYSVVDKAKMIYFTVELKLLEKTDNETDKLKALRPCRGMSTTNGLLETC